MPSGLSRKSVNTETVYDEGTKKKEQPWRISSFRSGAEKSKMSLEHLGAQDSKKVLKTNKQEQQKYTFVYIYVFQRNSGPN